MDPTLAMAAAAPDALPPMAFGTPVYLWAVAEDGKTLELFI